MTIQEYLSSKPGSLPDNIQIVGTDISSTMLRDADDASYDEMSLSHGISEDRKKHFFMPQGNKWQVRPEIKARASFRELFRPPPGRGDFIVLKLEVLRLLRGTHLSNNYLAKSARFMLAQEGNVLYTDVGEQVHDLSIISLRPQEPAGFRSFRARLSSWDDEYSCDFSRMRR